MKWSLWRSLSLREIRIERDVLEDVVEIAQGAHPKEALVFFSSTKGVRGGILCIDELQVQAYYASQESASVFTSNLPMTTSIVGTCHSHPSGSPQPSDADLHLFSKFGFVHAIVGAPYTLDTIIFYSKNGEKIRVEVV
jgi:proteasome lid subunit RPN8/RPN11